MLLCIKSIEEALKYKDRLLRTLVLLERDWRLYVWVGGGRGRSARGRRRGGAVAVHAREYAAASGSSGLRQFAPLDQNPPDTSPLLCT
jgi:hypothetical protein